MIPANFDYEAPRNLTDALTLLQSREDAKILAGGHSLLPAMKLRLAQPTLLVDIGRIKDLSYIREAGDRIAIGAMTTHGDIAGSQLLRKASPLLALAAATSVIPKFATVAPSEAPSPKLIPQRIILPLCLRLTPRSSPKAVPVSESSHPQVSSAECFLPHYATTKFSPKYAYRGPKVNAQTIRSTITRLLDMPSSESPCS